MVQRRGEMSVETSKEIPLEPDRPDTVEGFRDEWKDAHVEVYAPDDTIIVLTRTMREVSLVSLAILTLDLCFRAFVPNYPSPDWVPTLLSGGAVTAPLTAIMTLAKEGLARRRFQ
jgi:hypothetical protein